MKNSKPDFRWPLWRLFAMMVAFQPLQAQSLLFSETGWLSSQLNATQLEKYNKMAAPGQYTSLTIVQFNELSAVENEGEINLQISGSACGQVTFHATNVEYVSGSEFMWYGELRPGNTCECGTGDLFLSKTADGYTGHFRIENEAYSFE